MIVAVIISLILGIVLGALGMLWLLDTKAKESGIRIEVGKGNGLRVWQVHSSAHPVPTYDPRLDADTEELPVYGRHAAREED